MADESEENNQAGPRQISGALITIMMLLTDKLMRWPNVA